MKDISKRSDIVSRRAFKKSVHAAERQAGKREVAEAGTYDPFEFRHGFDDCSCYSCTESWMDYLPFLNEGTIGGRFLRTLERIDVIESWKDDYTMSELHYAIARSPEGIIASVYVQPDKLK